MFQVRPQADGLFTHRVLLIVRSIRTACCLMVHIVVSLTRKGNGCWWTNLVRSLGELDSEFTFVILVLIVTYRRGTCLLRTIILHEHLAKRRASLAFVASQAQYLLRFLLSLTTAHMASFIHILAYFDLMSRRDSRSRLLAGVFQVQNHSNP